MASMAAGGWEVSLTKDFSRKHNVDERAARFCRGMTETLPHDAVVFFSDEAHFHLSGCVNKQNFRYWSENNARVIHQKPLHSDRATVWCAVSRMGIIGPYFFEEGNRAATVNSERYVSILQNYFAPALEELGLENVWFQQDGAKAHTARASMQFSREMFPERLISLRGDIPWPARSPDLTPCDFFLWGYLTAEVYKHRPRNLQTLKEAIRTEIRRIPQEMLERVMRNFTSPLQQCLDNDGHHLADIIFKITRDKTSHVVSLGYENKLFVSRVLIF
jgi:hypothetical protein